MNLRVCSLLRLVLLMGALLTGVLLTDNVALAIDHTEDSLDTVRENLARKQAVLLDVREQTEWDRGHLQDARLLPLSELKRLGTDTAVKSKLAQLAPKNRIVYCHCAKGVRALSAATLLKKEGYDVRPLALGYDQLREAHFPAAEK